MIDKRDIDEVFISSASLFCAVQSPHYCPVHRDVLLDQRVGADFWCLPPLSPELFVFLSHLGRAIFLDKQHLCHIAIVRPSLTLSSQTMTRISSLLVLGSLFAMCMGCSNKAADNCVAFLKSHPYINCCQWISRGNYLCKNRQGDCNTNQMKSCQNFMLNEDDDGSLGKCTRVVKGAECQAPGGELCQ